MLYVKHCNVGNTYIWIIWAVAVAIVVYFPFNNYYILVNFIEPKSLVDKFLFWLFKVT